MSLNGKTVTTTDNCYAYRAHTEAMLNFGEDAARSHLELSGWLVDTKELDDLEKSDGHLKRVEWTKNSRAIEVIGNVHVDMCYQPLLILNNVDARFSFIMNNPDFYINGPTGDTSIVKIIDATLYIKYCHIAPQVLLAHNKMLAQTPAFYPYKRCAINTFVVASGSSTLSLDNIVNGQLPTSIIIMMVDTDAFAGSRDKNPFNFKTNGITELQLYVSGIQFPNETLAMNFSDESVYARAYSTLFSVNGILHSTQGNLITKEMYKNGSFMVGYDLSQEANGGNSSCVSINNQGSLRLTARFSKQLASSITVMAYMLYDSVIHIDSHRNVTVDYN